MKAAAITETKTNINEENKKDFMSRQNFGAEETLKDGDRKEENKKEKLRREEILKEYQANPLEELWKKPGVKILVIGTAIIGLLFASNYLLNGAAESIRAYKNLRRAVKER